MSALGAQPPDTCLSLPTSPDKQAAWPRAFPLPTLEEKQRHPSCSIQTNIVPINVSGRAERTGRASTRGNVGRAWGAGRGGNRAGDRSTTLAYVIAISAAIHNCVCLTHQPLFPIAMPRHQLWGHLVLAAPHTASLSDLSVCPPIHPSIYPPSSTVLSSADMRASA